MRPIADTTDLQAGTAGTVAPPSVQRPAAGDAAEPASRAAVSLEWSAPQAAMQVAMAATVVVFGTAIVGWSRLPLLLVPASFLLAAYGAGHVVSRLLGETVPSDVPIHVLSVRVGVGIAMLSIVASASAFTGLFRVAGVVVLLFGLVGLHSLRTLHATWVGWRLRPAWRDVWALSAGGLIVGVGWLIAWLWATVPPTFFDELEYHLVIPERALATGADHGSPWVFFTMMPHASDLLLAWGLALGGDLGGRAMVCALWIACALAAWGLAEIVAPPSMRRWAGPLVAAALAASPTLWFLAALPFAESALALGVVTAMAIVAAGSMQRTGAMPWVSVGLVLGFAATVKLTGVIYVGAVLLAALIARWPWRAGAVAALLVLLTVLPWSIRALVLAGNPVYPMAYQLFGGEYWDAVTQARVVGDLPVPFGAVSVGDVVRLPLDLIAHPERFGPVEGGLVAVVAVVLVLTAPLWVRLLGVAPGWRPLADAAAVCVAVAGLGWILTGMFLRYVAPTLILSLAALAGGLLHGRLPLRATAAAALLIGALTGTWTFLQRHDDAFAATRVALGQEAPQSYVARRLEHEAAARFVREQVPRDARLLFIGETRPYYFKREAIAPTAYDHHPLERWVLEADSPEALVARLATEGITHVVLNLREYNRLHERYGLLAFAGPTGAQHDQRLKQLPRALHLLFADRGVYVYEVPRRPASAPERAGRKAIG